VIVFILFLLPSLFGVMTFADMFPFSSMKFSTLSAMMKYQQDFCHEQVLTSGFLLPENI
jgi:hypothetical protein